jgi:flagellar protein FlaG
MDVNNIITNKVDISQTRASAVKSTEHIFTENAKSEKDIQLSKENIDNIINTLNTTATSVNQRVSFAFSDKTNRVILKFIDGDTNEVIREIPPKDMIRLLERMHDLIGVFVDESR